MTKYKVIIEVIEDDTVDPSIEKVYEQTFESRDMNDINFLIKQLNDR